jgi:hypothetical protein
MQKKKKRVQKTGKKDNRETFAGRVTSIRRVVVGGFSELPRPSSNLQKPSKGLSTGKVVCKP